MERAKVQSRGQVTIPQFIREACGVGPGTELFFAVNEDDTFTCHPLPPHRDILELIAEFAMDGPAPDMAKLREEIGDEMARKHLSRIASSDLPA